MNKNKLYRCYQLFLAWFIVGFSCLPARAFDIQTVISKNGIEAWLVEDHQVPIFSMAIGFKNISPDPADKLGLKSFSTSVIADAAGDKNYLAFQQKLEELGIELSARSGHDNITISVRGLSKFRSQTFDLIRDVLVAARFDDADVERTREQYYSYFRRLQESPAAIASQNWDKMFFANHPYGRPLYGTAETIARITQADLKDFAKKNLNRRHMLVVVVGDITPSELADLLDKTFNQLPVADGVSLWDTPVLNKTGLFYQPMRSSQTAIVFGHAGISREDPDYMVGYVLNEIMGAGGFSSRLMQKIRVENGLTYGISTTFYSLNYAHLLLGSLTTAAENTDRVIELIRTEWHKMGEEGPSQAELDLAKTHLIGSFPLRFDNTRSTASSLLGLRLIGYDKDYVTHQRQQLIEKITLNDAKRVAKRLFQKENLFFTIVGPTKPQSVK